MPGGEPIDLSAWVDAWETLPSVRAQLAREVEDAANDVAYLLDVSLSRPANRESVQVNGRFVSNDGRSTTAEWDWYWALAPETRAYLKPYFSASPTASAPDQWTAITGVDCFEWVRAVLLDTAARMLSRGRHPQFRVSAATTYDLDAIYGPDGHLELARYYMEEAA